MWGRSSDYKRVPGSQGQNANPGGTMNESFPPAATGKSSTAIPSGTKVITMKVISSTDINMALTNRAYCSPDDISLFPEGMIKTKDQIVLTVSPDPSVKDGCIALNAMQRRNIKVSADDDVKVERFIPEKGSDLGVLGVELSFVKFRGKQETVDANNLKQRLSSLYGGQMMSVGQVVSFEYLGTNYIFTVKETILKDVPRVSALGLWVKETHLQFETSPTSGIKVLSTN